MTETDTETDKVHRDVQFARLLVVVATVALFLTMAMTWYDTSDDDLASYSGWETLGDLTGDKKGMLVFAGWFGFVVVVAALLAGAGVLQLRQRWVGATLSVLLTLLAVGMALVHLQYDGDDPSSEQLTAAWASVAVMVFAAVAWGNLVGPLRQLSYETA